jgi:isopentenyldiphosphate isomerase
VHADRAEPRDNAPGVAPPSDTAEVEPEIVDIYDERGGHIGTAERRQVHRNGAWHRCFHCIIVAHRGHGLEVTLQRRSRAHQEYPGLVDVSVAGHLQAGEAVVQGSRREILEELGTEVAAEQLESIGEYSLVFEQDALFSRELTDVLLLVDERQPRDYVIDPLEVASLVSIGLVDATELWSGLRHSVLAVEWESDHGHEINLEISEFVNDVPEYWPWLAAVLARRFGFDDYHQAQTDL